MFLELNDGSCQHNIQVVIDAGVPGFEAASKALAGSSYLVEGVLKASQAKGQKVELHATSVNLLCGSEEN